ncbi:hypothetical protein EW146_g8875 [Bondarzewia mesenterica]|uniref:Uncharacterized protein n=1 Tax=Bondarzewia mesenterica TaxID=1095465 RepID=A0A4S4LB29_9AGAM|nr:hypothetical protein EW146_g8875 [Bondarzewia mesenterica]
MPSDTVSPVSNVILYIIAVFIPPLPVFMSAFNILSHFQSIKPLFFDILFNRDKNGVVLLISSSISCSGYSAGSLESFTPGMPPYP